MAAGDWNYTRLSGINGINGTGITIRYSKDKTEWSSQYSDGDVYMEISTDEGKTWTDPMKIVGEDGNSSFIYIRYATDENGTGMTETPSGTTPFIGICVTTETTAPTDPESYKPWTRFVGGLDVTPPTVPTITSVTSNEEGSVTIVFTKSEDTETGVSFYQIYRKTATSNYVLIGKVDHSDSVSSYSFFDIAEDKNKIYTYAVSACDKIGNMSDKSAGSTITNTVTVLPNAPTGVRASAEEGRLVISWEPNYSANTLKNPISYTVEFKLSSTSNWEEICNTGSDNYTYLLDVSKYGYLEKSSLSGASVRVKSNSAYGTSSAYVNTSYIDVSNYKSYKISEPSISVKAIETGLSISLENKEDEYYLIPEYTVKFGTKEIYKGGYKDNIFMIYDGNPTKAVLDSTKIELTIKTTADTFTKSNISVDTSEFKGWVPEKPQVYSVGNGRSISLSWDLQDVYDFNGCKIQVAKGYKLVNNVYTVITNTSELEWYAPALGLNPYASVDNYKKGNKNEYLSVKGTSVSFSVPLYGQADSASVNTMYAYRFKAYTEHGESEWSDLVWVEAKATSAYDVVKAWNLNNKGEKVKVDGALGVQQIFVEELAALSANLGYITDGALKGDQYNYWAVNDTKLSDGSTMYKGSFRVGGANQYIKVTPKLINGVASGDFDVDFVVNDVTISSAGTKVEGKSFTVYDTNGNLMFQTAPEGNKIRVNEGSYRSYTPNVSKIKNYMYSSYYEDKDCSFGYNGHLYRITHRNTKLQIIEDDNIIYTSSSVVYDCEIYNHSSGIVSIPVDRNSTSNSLTIIRANLGTKTFTSSTVSLNESTYGSLLAIFGSTGYTSKGYFIDLVSGSTTKASIATSVGVGFFYNGSLYIPDNSTGLMTLIFKIDFASKTTSVCGIRLGMEETDSTERKFIVRGCKDGMYISFANCGYFTDSSTFVKAPGVAFMKWSDMKWSSTVNGLSDVTPMYFYRGDIPTGMSIGYTEDFIFLQFDFDSETQEMLNGKVIKMLIEEGTKTNIIGGYISGTVKQGNIMFPVSEYVQSFIAFPTFYMLYSNDEYFYKFSIPSFNETTSDGNLTSTPYYVFTFYTNPYELINSSEVYGAGIGFVSILYDVDSKNYKYKLDTGAYLEFDENGELVARGKQGLPGARGEKGDKGDKGDDGVTPTIKAAAGSNINAVGTPTVTATKNGNETTFTFNYLKGQKGDTVSVVDNLTSTSTTAALSANQGKVLNDGKLNVSGSNGTAAGVSALINKLSTGDSDPVDADYYVSQSANGGTTTTTYHRRPISKLWNYIKSKMSNVLKINDWTTFTTYRYASSESPTTTYYWYKLGTWNAYKSGTTYYNNGDSYDDVFEIETIGDSNYPYFGHYILRVSRYQKSSVSLVLECLGKTGMADFAVGFDAAGCVYIQCSGTWQNRSRIRVKSGNGAVKTISLGTAVGYASFGTASGFTALKIFSNYGAHRFACSTSGVFTYATQYEVNLYANKFNGTATNADTVDNYHASSLWRSDGATWNPGANVACAATANSQDWSFDITRNGKTGCYWHVWDSVHGSILKVNADDGVVSAPKGGFSGKLTGNVTGNVTGNCSGSSGSCTGNAATASKADFASTADFANECEKAEMDADGNDITSTYAKKSAVCTVSLGSNVLKKLSFTVDGTYLRISTERM